MAAGGPCLEQEGRSALSPHPQRSGFFHLPRVSTRPPGQAPRMRGREGQGVDAPRSEATQRASPGGPAPPRRVRAAAAGWGGQQGVLTLRPAAAAQAEAEQRGQRQHQAQGHPAPRILREPSGGALPPAPRG